MKRGTRKRNKSFNGWELVNFDYLYEWSENGMIIDPNGEQVWTRDDSNTEFSMPKYEVSGLSRNDSKLVQLMVHEKTKRRVYNISKTKETDNRKARPGSISNGKKKKNGLMFKTLEVEKSNTLLVRVSTLALFDDEGTDAGTLDEETARMAVESQGEVKFLHFGKDAVLVCYSSIRAAERLFGLLEGEGCIYCCAPYAFENSGVLYHPNTLEVSGISGCDVGEIASGLACRESDIHSIEPVGDHSVFITFLDIACCEKVFLSTTSFAISFKPFSENELRLRSTLTRFIECPEHSLKAFNDLVEKPLPSASPAPKELPEQPTDATPVNVPRSPVTNRYTTTNGENVNVRGIPPQSRSAVQQGGGKNVAFQVSVDNVRSGKDKRTSVMIRNIPNKYTQKMVLEELNGVFFGTYDFFYLPIDFRNKCNIGYAFLNFKDPSTIVDCFQFFHNRRWNNFNSDKICAVSYAKLQGRDALISRFENSSVMEMEEECRPVIFDNNNQRLYLSGGGGGSTGGTGTSKHQKKSRGSHQPKKGQLHATQPEFYPQPMMYQQPVGYAMNYQQQPMSQANQNPTPAPNPYQNPYQNPYAMYFPPPPR